MTPEYRRKRLIRLMGKHGLTVEQVADMMGRKPGTVRIWRSESPVCDISDHALELLEYKLGEK